ncbi:NAD(P)H-dependent oxidoreductase [Elizabethkingia meningoseptica]|uniref:NAD(P)H-dependent oxidoreductase n=1 Tax=Elizabethkingia meningoseptica TaxID=238 RepID=UPI003892C3F1
MEKVFVINGGQTFAHSGGTLNKSITGWTKEILEKEGFQVRVSHVDNEFDPVQEAEHFKWADVVVYHFPVWWFQVPNRLKFYIDEVFTAGHKNGIYESDGRSRSNPQINYGTGGLMHGKKYFVTTSWNAPDTAFTMEGEFFQQKSVDEGVLFGFHRMNAFTGMELLGSFHLHDMEKNATIERINQYEIEYKKYLQEVFVKEKCVLQN